MQKKNWGDEAMVSKKVTILNPSGLHLKNATILSNSVLKYRSLIQFTYEENDVQGIANVKSILSILAAGICQGQTIEVTCSGEDEVEALQAVVDAINSGLGEKI